MELTLKKIGSYKKYFTDLLSLSAPLIVGNLGQILIGDRKSVV